MAPNRSVLIASRITGGKTGTPLIAAGPGAAGALEGGTRHGTWRVIEYDRPGPGRATGKDELIVLVTTIHRPSGRPRAQALAGAYHQRWETRDRQRPAQDMPARSRAGCSARGART